jgi:hypothetical protein
MASRTLILAAVALLGFPAMTARADLDSNREHLIRDWGAHMGYANVCEAWQSLNCSLKGAFLTLTHRLQ